MKKFNDTKFKVYNHESAYWAGFIAADGYVADNRLAICLKKSDLTHLEKFRDFMESTNLITVNDKYERAEINLHSFDMIKDLEVNYNIVNKKSLTPEFPKQLPIEFYPSL